MSKSSPTLVPVPSHPHDPKPRTLTDDEAKLLESLREYRYPGADSFIQKWLEGSLPGSLFDILRQEIRPLHELFSDLSDIEQRFLALSSLDATGLLRDEFEARLRRMMKGE